ncbi:thioredoxin family protein [Egbenema bharatensis]|uniref:thioredoxin family protein n=1 Tax=Egbenema bharatensis TaxID=3463334 RepID=UPI003A8BD20D
MTSAVIGHYAPDFELPGTDGSVHHLAKYLQTFRAIGVVIMGNHCPYVQSYLDRLKCIQTEFFHQGVTLIGINPNDDNQCPEDSFDAMKSFVIEHQLNFPYLRDVTQDVAQGFGAKWTPEVFLIDQAGLIRYGGAIDDSPQTPDAVTVRYLRDAIEQLLAGRGEVGSTTAVGCPVKWRQPQQQ